MPSTNAELDFPDVCNQSYKRLLTLLCSFHLIIQRTGAAFLRLGGREVESVL